MKNDSLRQAIAREEAQLAEKRMRGYRAIGYSVGEIAHTLSSRQPKVRLNFIPWNRYFPIL